MLSFQDVYFQDTNNFGTYKTEIPLQEIRIEQKGDSWINLSQGNARYIKFANHVQLTYLFPQTNETIHKNINIF